MISVDCPECGAELEFPTKHAGMTSKCPDCGKRFKIPSAETKAPPRKEASRPVKSSTTGKTSPKPKRPRRDEDDDDAPVKKSGSNAVLILGIAGGGVVALLAVVVVVFMVMRSGKSDTPVAQNVQPIQQVRMQDPPLVTKKAPETKTEPDNKDKAAEPGPSATVEVASGIDHGQLVYKHVLKSAAWILVKKGEQASMGSGTLVDRKNRLVLTNHHVAGEADSDLLVFFPVYRDGKPISEREVHLKQTRREDLIHCKLLAFDKKRDLALLEIEKVPDGVEALTLAKQSTGPGTTVHSIGNPGTSDSLWVYTSGTVRQVYHKRWKAGSRDPKEPLTDHESQVVETQSPINGGDSGGPLVNARGELIGVTQSYLQGSQVVSLFIDVTEAASFIEKTCQDHLMTWERSSRVVVASNAGGVPGLIRNLESTDAKGRSAAAKALGEIGPEAIMAVPQLLKIASSEADELTQRLVMDALNKIGPPEKRDLALLADYMKDARPEVRTYAARSAGRVGQDASAHLPALLKLAKDRDAGVRQAAVRSLGNMGLTTKETVLPVISDGLKDADRGVRLAGGDALAGITNYQAADLPILQEALKHQDVEVRTSAAYASGQMGSVAKSLLPALAEAFKGSTDKNLRHNIIEALSKMAVPAKDAVPIYTEALGETDKTVRKTALTALAKAGPSAKDATAALAGILTDSDKELRLLAATTLGKIGPDAKDAVPALADALKEDDRAFLLEVINTLGAIGPNAKAAIPNLIAVFEGQVQFKSAEKVMHEKCAKALGKIGKDAVPDLIKALNHDSVLVRIGAALALGEIGPPAKRALPLLVARAQSDEDPNVRGVANTAAIKVSAK